MAWQTMSTEQMPQQMRATGLGQVQAAHLLLGLAGMAHDKGHILDLPEGRHGRVARQAQQQIRARVVLRDLPHHAPVRAVPAHQVLAVYEVCAAPDKCLYGAPQRLELVENGRFY